MYIKLTNGIPENYSIAQLRRDNTQVSFPKDLLDDALAEYEVYPLVDTPKPTYDTQTQRITEGTPVQQDGQWTQTWIVTDLTQDEIIQAQTERAELVRQQRQAAYEQEADPLFFKAQRGETTTQVWLDKVAEIKARYPE